MATSLFQTIARSAKAVVPIKAWTRFVPQIETAALDQLHNLSTMPFVHSHVAVMPDVHHGKGSTIGTVFPTTNAIIPAAVGVDIGCGMCAVRTSVTANDLPQSLKKLRTAIESKVPVGMAGFTTSSVPKANVAAWDATLKTDFERLCSMHPSLEKTNNMLHLGTLGTGNHFIEMCLDNTLAQNVWIMLHSGSRGVGNKIGTHFIDIAKKDMRKTHMLQALPDADLAYLQEGTQHFEDYVFAVGWAQRFAFLNRQLMMSQVVGAIRETGDLPRDFTTDSFAVNCHHNYVQKEHHFGQDVYLTRKGAVRAGLGDLGIIPGSMGEKSYIVRGLGNKDSFESCSHGAGRLMSRTAAKKQFTLADHIERTKGVECRKDEAVIDETPGCYKDIDAVMKSQEDLVEVLYTLKQVLCVKG
eukprot:TRINITY_DN5786_c0_g1_i5.p1 TRINITY_DN5786_c0_g1~~TRINITY_DN5786_c0_g1_i5.p1  ORF type:complete len:412 (-),score=58.84 TRINITY_DN5786_c0_g1_i5:236-1471(-)